MVAPWPIHMVQFRDLVAKAASDKTENEAARDAKLQLGDRFMATTEQFVRQNLGQK